MPRDGLWGTSGERLQGWIRRKIASRARVHSGGFTHSELGLVVGRYFPDEDGNNRGIVTEYDVFLPHYRIILHNVVMKIPYQSVHGGEQITLKAAGVPDSEDPGALWRNVMESDGDLVTVTFVSGRWPMIDGCVNHIRDSGSADWHTDSADGEVYSLSYNTTRARVNKDGNVEIDLDDNEAPPDRSLIINAGTKQLMKISYDDGAGEVRIELGSGAIEKLVLGETFQTWWNANVPHNHTIGGATGAASAGTPHTHPLSGTATSSTEIPNFDSDNLTEKVKAEK